MTETVNPWITAERRDDRRLGAAVMLLEAIEFESCVTADGIDSGAVLKEIGKWSHGEQIIAKLALDLSDPGCLEAGGHTAPRMAEICRVLDDRLFETVIMAMRHNRRMR
jgi:hypothetical protein